MKRDLNWWYCIAIGVIAWVLIAAAYLLWGGNYYA